MTEPDALSEGFEFAPRLLISKEGIAATKLERPGSLTEYSYKVKFANAGAVAKDVREKAEKDFPDSGWRIRTSANASPALSSNIERFSQFLTLVGLTALVVGGVGVANAVQAHLDGKRTVIATLKCLGASGNFAALVYFLQILIIASIGIAIGLAACVACAVRGGFRDPQLPAAGCCGRVPSRWRCCWPPCSAI